MIFSVLCLFFASKFSFLIEVFFSLNVWSDTLACCVINLKLVLAVQSERFVMIYVSCCTVVTTVRCSTIPLPLYDQT